MVPLWQTILGTSIFVLGGIAIVITQIANVKIDRKRKMLPPEVQARIKKDDEHWLQYYGF